jgi:hypothetical protein
MRRVRNWDVQVTHWAIAQVGKPFVWGETDCVSLLRGLMRCLYGKTYGPALEYHTLREALNVEEQTGGARKVVLDLEPTVLPLSYASTGDVLIDQRREGDPFEAVLCVITDKALFSEPDSVVKLIPLSTVPPGVTLYRLPNG